MGTSKEKKPSSQAFRAIEVEIRQPVRREVSSIHSWRRWGETAERSAHIALMGGKGPIVHNQPIGTVGDEIRLETL